MGNGNRPTPEFRREAVRLALADREPIRAAELGDGLVMVDGLPINHITSTLRPASRSSRRLDGIKVSDSYT